MHFCFSLFILVFNTGLCFFPGVILSFVFFINEIWTFLVLFWFFQCFLLFYFYCLHDLFPTFILLLLMIGADLHILTPCDWGLLIKRSHKCDVLVQRICVQLLLSVADRIARYFIIAFHLLLAVACRCPHCVKVEYSALP